MAADKTPDSVKSELQLEIERLNAVNAALIGEFNTKSGDGEDESPSKVREELGKGVLDAVQQIRNLAITAESESVRASCSKYIIDMKLGRFDKTKDDSAELADLLNELRSNDSKV